MTETAKRSQDFFIQLALIVRPVLNFPPPKCIHQVNVK